MQDSPRGEADGQSYIFPQSVEEYIDGSENDEFNISLNIHDSLHAPDSGIDSIQASPNTITYLPGAPVTIVTVKTLNESPSSPLSTTSEIFDKTFFNSTAAEKNDTSNNKRKQSLARRPSNALLHPDHALLLALPNRSQTSPESTEDLTEFMKSGYKNGLGFPQQFCTASSSTNSSLTSIAGYCTKNQR